MARRLKRIGFAAAPRPRHDLDKIPFSSDTVTPSRRPAPSEGGGGFLPMLASVRAGVVAALVAVATLVVAPAQTLAQTLAQTWPRSPSPPSAIRSKPRSQLAAARASGAAIRPANDRERNVLLERAATAAYIAYQRRAPATRRPRRW
jgi:hypothetical protein